MELLGPSLWDVWNGPADQALSEQYVACVAVEALTILEHLHNKGCDPAERPCDGQGAEHAHAGEFDDKVASKLLVRWCEGLLVCCPVAIRVTTLEWRLWRIRSGYEGMQCGNSWKP